MTPGEFAALVRARAGEIRRAWEGRWPRMMRKEAQDHFREGFRRGGYIDKGLERWDETRRQGVPFAGAAGRYGPLLSRTNDLMGSIDGRLGPGAVEMFSDSPHARYHNEGAEAQVTPRMRRYFWARAAEAKRARGGGDPEALFWRNMALTRKDKIRIPRRRFMGPAETLLKTIRRAVEDDLKRILEPR